MNIKHYLIALAALLLVAPLSHAQSGGKSCDWRGRDVYPICANKQSGWGKEKGQKCISAKECRTAQPSNKGGIINTKKSSPAAPSKPMTTKKSSNADQCNSTNQCQAVYGNRATDCANSQSTQSLCFCGSARCDKKAAPTANANNKKDKPKKNTPAKKAPAKAKPAKTPKANKAANNGVVLLETGGLVAIESESFTTINNKSFKAKWRLTANGNVPNVKPDPDPKHISGASGSQYLEILPDTRVTHSDKTITSGTNTNLFTKSGVGPVVDYQVFFNTPGTYYVWLRAYSTGSEDNGVHVGINGSWPSTGERVQWCTGKQRWTWSSAQRVDSNHCGTPKTIKLKVPSKGIHTVSVSMREDGFELDKIILSKSKNFEPSGQSIKQKFYKAP